MPCMECNTTESWLCAGRHMHRTVSDEISLQQRLNHAWLTQKNLHKEKQRQSMCAHNDALKVSPQLHSTHSMQQRQRDSNATAPDRPTSTDKARRTPACAGPMPTLARPPAWPTARQAGHGTPLSSAKTRASAAIHQP